jgi:ABC-2 type transport system ATP-binding protein
MPISESTISIQNLTKRFGKKSAVQDLTTEIKTGSVCGLIGPNGAGKTTTLRMLLGLLSPSSGQMQVLDLDPKTDAFQLRQRTGYVPEQHHIYEWMKVRRVLKFTSEVYPHWDWAECNRITELLGLPMEQKVKELSRGELAKLALTIALAHKPELLLLDEPTSGLDPLIRREFLEAIIHLIEKEGRTVVFSTHILSDVERVADQVIVLAEGKVVADDSLEGLRARYTKASFLFTTPPAGDATVPEALRVEKGLREWIAVFKAKTESEIRDTARQLGALDCTLQPMSLEDIFVELVGK